MRSHKRTCASRNDVCASRTLLIFYIQKAPTKVLLKAVLNGQNVEWPLIVDFSAAKDGKMLHTLAARQMIRDLEEGINSRTTIGAQRR